MQAGATNPDLQASGQQAEIDLLRAALKAVVTLFECPPGGSLVIAFEKINNVVAMAKYALELTAPPGTVQVPTRPARLDVGDRATVVMQGRKRGGVIQAVVPDGARGWHYTLVLDNGLEVAGPEHEFAAEVD